MKKNFNLVMIFLVLTIIFLSFSACNTTSVVTFNSIVIKGEDVENIEEGNYSLRYTIENLDKYKRNNPVEVVVTVTDKYNQSVSLINDRILFVEKNNEYLVSILVTSGDKYKTHNFTVKGVKTTILVTFTAGEYENFEDFVYEIYFGEDLKELPEVPEHPEGEDFIDQYWTMENPAEVTSRLPAPVTQANLTNLRQDLTLYAYYERDPLAEYTIEFETFGGTEIQPIIDVFQSGITPPPIPEKENHAFFGWYEDEEFNKRFFFPENPTMPAKNLTLYARWIEQIEGASDESFFEYELVEDVNLRNLEFVKIKANPDMTMPENLVIPRFIDNKPVVEIEPNAFVGIENIKTLTIPYTIMQVGSYAFSGKKTSPVQEFVMQLETVIFEDTKELVQIQNYAFSYNKNLIQINIPDSVEAIGKRVFEGCEKLTSVDFGSSLSYIDEKAFFGCSALENIELPKSLTTIEFQAFYNCDALKTVVLKNEDNVVTLKDNVFSNDEGDLDITIYVPNNMLEEYQSDDNLKYKNFTILPISD